MSSKASPRSPSLGAASAASERIPWVFPGYTAQTPAGCSPAWQTNFPQAALCWELRWHPRERTAMPEQIFHPRTLARRLPHPEGSLRRGIRSTRSKPALWAVHLESSTMGKAWRASGEGVFLKGRRDTPAPLQVPSSLFHGIAESWDGLVGRDLKTHPVPLPAIGKDTFHYPRMFQAPSNCCFFAVEPQKQIKTSRNDLGLLNTH